MNMNKKLLSVIALLGVVASAPLSAEHTITLTNGALGDVEVYLGEWTAMPTEAELASTSKTSPVLLLSRVIVDTAAAVTGQPYPPSKCVITPAHCTGLVIKHLRSPAMPIGPQFKAFFPIPAGIREIRIIEKGDGTAEIRCERGLIEGVVFAPLITEQPSLTEQPSRPLTRQDLLRQMGGPTV